MDHVNELPAIERSHVDRSMRVDNSTTSTSVYHDNNFERQKRHLLENASVRTPFSNIGDVQSKYAGNNQTLNNWYGMKRANIKNVLKGNQNAEYAEIYSQFSKASGRNYRTAEQTFLEDKQADQEVTESLRNNEYFSKQTFEEFLERKKTGKRALFYLKPTKSQNVELYHEYLKQIKAKQTAKLLEKADQIEAEKNDIADQLEKNKRLNDSSVEKKQSQAKLNKHYIEQKVQENRQLQHLERMHDNEPEIEYFPFLEGEQILEKRAVLNEAKKSEMVKKMERDRAGKAAKDFSGGNIEYLDQVHIEGQH